MADGVYVKVPKDLADCLVDDGFRSAGIERGIDSVLADGANLVTVLVGSHEISRFVGQLWAAMRRRGNSPAPGLKVIAAGHSNRRPGNVVAAFAANYRELRAAGSPRGANGPVVQMGWRRGYKLVLVRPGDH